MRGAAFIDLDGTLLGPNQRVSPENAKAILRLREAGYAIVYASGRHQRNMAMLVDDLEWVVSSQGTVARHFVTGETVFERGLEFDDIVMLEALARAREIGLIAYHRESVHAERRTPWIDSYTTMAGWAPLVGPFEALPKLGFQKVLLTTDPDVIALMREEETFARFHAVITEPQLLELLPRGTNKASAAQAVAERLGISPASCLAFGDGNNDVELLAWAGNSFAMPHGREAAKRAAKQVCPPGPPETAFASAVNEALGR
jgi:Cof subfamily protein (haloacid dehalogenase superfamily)